MKIVKMKIRRIEEKGVTRYEYPTPHYNKDKVKFLQYEAGAQARGENYQYILVGVKNEDLQSFLDAEGFNKNGFIYEATEVTREEAISDGETWVTPVEKITDVQKVIGILAKVARKEDLTKAEEDAIDPAKPTRGINKTATFTESLDKAINNPKFA